MRKGWSILTVRLQIPSNMPEEYGKGPSIRPTTHTHLLICYNTLRLPLPSSISRTLSLAHMQTPQFSSPKMKGSNISYEFHGLWRTIRSNIKCAEINWTFRRPLEKQDRPSIMLKMVWMRWEISRYLSQQHECLATAKMDTTGHKIRAALTRLEKIPQATSCQERNQILN
jgi:hypothetical protein